MHCAADISLCAGAAPALASDRVSRCREGGEPGRSEGMVDGALQEWQRLFATRCVDVGWRPAFFLVPLSPSC